MNNIDSKQVAAFLCPEEIRDIGVESHYTKAATTNFRFEYTMTTNTAGMAYVILTPLSSNIGATYGTYVPSTGAGSSGTALTSGFYSTTYVRNFAYSGFAVTVRPIIGDNSYGKI